jgi:hypothetical protein
MRDMVLHLWERLVLSALVRGFRLPGSLSVENRLSQQRHDELERKILVREIKRSRQLVPHGPLWLGSRLESVLRYLERRRVLFQVGAKMAVALVVIVIPVTCFMIIRGILPVPSRIPFANSATHLPRYSNLRTDWPYTVGPFVATQVARVQEANLLPMERFRGASVVPVLENGAPPGLTRISVGDFPARVESFRGFLVSERAPLRVFRQRSPRIDIAGQNRILVRTFLFPSSDATERCRLEVRNQEGELLVASESGSQVVQVSSSTLLGKDFRERLTPQMLRRSGGVLEHSVETDDPPEALTVSVSRLGGDDERHPSEPAAAVSSAYASQLVGFLERGGVARDLSNDRCVFGVGHFSYEKTMVAPLKRRGIVLVAVDFLRSAVVADATLMPNVRRYFTNTGTMFEQHYSTGNTPTIATASVLSSRFYGEMVRSVEARRIGDVPSLEGGETIPSLMLSEGYRPVAIGRLSAEDRNPWSESVLIQNKHYESRSITEEAGNWLEEYGHAPFLLYLHYGTFHPPFRPPFDALSVSRFLVSPFGLGAERELEAGVARAWDLEFSLLVRKLEMLGIGNDVDVILVSTQGSQVEALPYGNVSGAPADLVGAVRSEGPLTDDELHVPLLMRLGGVGNQSTIRTVSRVSSHLDLLPTLADLVDARAQSPLWRGGSLLSLVSGGSGVSRGTLNRSWLYAESSIGAAVFRPAGIGTNTGLKLIRLFSPFEATAFTSSAPWRQDFHWRPHEIFSSVEASSRREEWSPYQRELEKQWARRALMENLTAPLRLGLSRSQGGPFGGTIRFSLVGEEPDYPRVIEMPSGVSLERRETDSTVELRFSGDFSQGDVVRILFLPGTMRSMNVDGSLALSACGGLFPTADLLVETIRAGFCLDSSRSANGSTVLMSNEGVRALKVDLDVFDGKEEDN